MDVILSRKVRNQKAIRLTDEERADLHTVAKSVFKSTESEAIAILSTVIANAYRNNKDSKELNIKIKLG